MDIRVFRLYRKSKLRRAASRFAKRWVKSGGPAVAKLEVHLRKALAGLGFALALSWLCVASDARAQSSDPDEVLATIGSTRITAEEVDRILAGRNALAGLSEEERRQRTLETLIAEYLIDYFYGQDLGLLSEQVLDSLADARRQVLFQLFAQSRFEAPEIAEADVAAFVAENPQLFADRRAYQYLDLRIIGGTPEARATALARVPGALASGAAPLTALTSLVADLSRNGLNATVNPVWATSEALPADTLARLTPMAADGRELDQWTTADSARALVLLAADPAPLDADTLTPQIERRLLQQAFQAHRDEIITLMAKSVLEADAAAAADPRVVSAPPRGTVVWSPNPVLPREVRLAGFFGGALFSLIALYGILTWSSLVRRQFPQLQRHELTISIIRRGTPASVLAAILTLAVLGASGLGVWLASSLYGTTATMILYAGAGIIALAICLVWAGKTRRARQATLEEYKELFSDAGMAVERAGLAKNPTPRLLVSFVLLVLAFTGLAVLLDLQIPL